MRRTLEPEVEKPPVRVWRDWVLVAAVVEAVVRDGTVWRLIAVALGLTLALAMLWRRTHPLMNKIGARNRVQIAIWAYRTRRVRL